jgi:Arc/MetJ-type ribon-helix-helix transcriptional regulator
MEIVSVKFESNLLHDIEKTMKKYRYATKAEFIREAIRQKIKALEKDEALARVRRLYGASKRKTTDKELRKAREEVFEELEKEFGIK